jgi:hypothetical protein
MTLYFENVDTAETHTLPVPEGTATYAIDLPPGTYHAYAWLEGFTVGGSYSEFVPCGLSVECSDHTLIPVTVAAGQTVSGVDIQDWYGPPGTVPYPPGVEPPTGNIDGLLHYPSEGIPAMTVYVRNLADNATYSQDLPAGTQTFTFEGLPVGLYHVFAWVPGGLGGAYTQAVPCGLSVECTDHTLIEVPVNAGQTTGGVDIGDWYAQEVVPLP